MIAVDLCCGRGGWTRGLQAAGWTVYGFDVAQDPLYPGKFIQGDVRELSPADLRRMAPSLIVASPPCQEFSFRDLPFGRSKQLPPPDLTIAETCFRLAREIGVPIILENVRGAQKYLGTAGNHFGPYYLWGNVPALLPFGKPEKGLHLSRGTGGRRIRQGPNRYASNSPKRKNWTAEASMIPFELARFIGETFATAEVI